VVSLLTPPPTMAQHDMAEQIRYPRPGRPWQAPQSTQRPLGL